VPDVPDKNEDSPDAAARAVGPFSLLLFIFFITWFGCIVGFVVGGWKIGGLFGAVCGFPIGWIAGWAMCYVVALMMAVVLKTLLGGPLWRSTQSGDQ
jgi:hypothetical protein